MNKKKLLTFGLYGSYGLFVILPILLGFIPASWGRVTDIADTILSYQELGYITSILILVAPFLFLWLYRRKKHKVHLVATVVSVVVFIFIAVGILLLVRTLQEL